MKNIKEDLLVFLWWIKRDRIVEELFTTERTYVRNLNICIELHQKYIYYLAKYGKITLKNEEAQTLFGNLKDIINVNTLLLDDIENRFEVWDENSSIGDIIKKKTLSFFKDVHKLYNQF